MGGVRRPFHVRQKDGSPYWQLDCTIPGGDRVREALKTRIADDPDKRKADQEAGARWLALCRGAGLRPEAGSEIGTAVLIAQYVETDLAARARKRGARYAEVEELRLNLHVQPRFASIQSITSASWKSAQDDMHEKGMKLDTIRKTTVSLRLFLRYCHGLGAISEIPTLTAPSGEEVALEAPDRRAFTEEERAAFLATMKKIDKRAHRVYTALLYTALRKSGLERMLPGWINWQTGFATFPASAMKKRKPRSFYLHPMAREAIRRELGGRERDLKPIFGRFDYDGHGKNNAGERKGAFWKAIRAAGIDPDGLTAHHVTRHTACSIAGNNGATLAELMALGGWDTPAMAMRYFHADAKQAKGAIEKL